MKTVPLQYPLPNREWYRTAHGWASREWTAAAKRQAEAGRVKQVK